MRTVSVDSGSPTTRLKIRDLRFDESGWFLVRAIAAAPLTFRFGCTGPFYLEIGGSEPRISKTSTQFFLDWVRERKANVEAQNFKGKEEILPFYEDAEKFWLAHLSKANAE
jgi:hypothetical protein